MCVLCFYYLSSLRLWYCFICSFIYFFGKRSVSFLVSTLRRDHKAAKNAEYWNGKRRRQTSDDQNTRPLPQRYNARLNSLEKSLDGTELTDSRDSALPESECLSHPTTEAGTTRGMSVCVRACAQWLQVYDCVHYSRECQFSD